MLEFKFSQVFPVYPVRLSSFYGGTDSPHNPTQSSAANKEEEGGIGNHSATSNSIQIPNSVQGGEPAAELKTQLKSTEREILSYKKTIKTLEEELDSLRVRVRDLERARHESQSSSELAANTSQRFKRDSQGMGARESQSSLELGIRLKYGCQGNGTREKDSLSSSGISNSSTHLEELAKELELERAEKEKFQQLFEEEREQVCVPLFPQRDTIPLGPLMLRVS